MNEEQRDELIAEKAGLLNLLTQKDYAARKVAFEVAGIIKQMHPEVQMPFFDKYIAMENQAQQFRTRIDEIDELLAE